MLQAGRVSMPVPRNRMLPPLIGSTPDTRLKTVLLPVPFGPMSPRTSVFHNYCIPRRSMHNHAKCRYRTLALLTDRS